MKHFNIEAIPAQKGKIAIVTGANIGLGFETTLSFVQKEIHVVMACRNPSKAEAALQTIKQQVPHASVEIMLLDLGSQQSVRNFAAAFLQKHAQLDLLINNAGIMVPPFSITEDGFESQMAANYFGHFLLTGLLLPTIRKTPHARIVSLSSIAHKQGKIDFEDMQGQKRYNAMKSYSQSKLACLMFAYELNRKLQAAGEQTLSVAAHPGVSDTALFKGPAWLLNLLRPLMRMTVVQSANDGAQPTLYAALGADIQGGDYTGPDGWNEMKGKAVKTRSTPLSHDKAVAQKLWEVSEKLCNIQYSFDK